VLKNRKTNAVLFVVLFTLFLNEDLDEEGNVKPGVEAGLPFDKMEKVRNEWDKARMNGTGYESSREGSVAGMKVNGRISDDDDVD
jgi:hypothetical protein